MRLHAHALAHAAVYLQTLQVCENNAASSIRPSRSAGGRAPSGSLVESNGGGGGGGTIKLCCLNVLR